ncbi:divalent cation transporter [Alteromonas aestuariivivens]|uniref:Divalent cation transporter n=1 Tax=Alteromonas aestuariivivens TaxID=1938339 RepID=A0A3D8MD92_9ALTE|nr:divalent cation transporter [Alteromonas aestuariivivens]RDV28209.1 divalent cation transporter [Alteromonas aestuariivivens]
MQESGIISLLVIALLAGLAMPAGAMLGFVPAIFPRWLQEELRHGILALGAGALLSAVALVLVPEGIRNLEIFAACYWFLAGAVAFMLLDVWLARNKTPASQLAAMLSDFVPESIALGSAAALGGGTLLLGILIAVQNIPEGFNAYRELKARGRKNRRKLVWAFCVMALLGPLCSLLGFYWLSHYPEVVSAIMLFAAGGILYTVLQDIAPQVHMKNHWLPSMGGVLGFMVGILGAMLEG